MSTKIIQFDFSNTDILQINGHENIILTNSDLLSASLEVKVLLDLFGHLVTGNTKDF